MQELIQEKNKQIQELMVYAKELEGILLNFKFIKTLSKEYLDIDIQSRKLYYSEKEKTEIE